MRTALHRVADIAAPMLAGACLHDAGGWGAVAVALALVAAVIGVAARLGVLDRRAAEDTARRITG